MYYTPGQFFKIATGCLVHQYSPFDGNYTLEKLYGQFDETICFFKLMGKMCVCTNEFKKVTVPAQFFKRWFYPPKKHKSVNRS